MFLMDESLFRHWRAGTCDKEEVLLKSSRPNDLAARIAMAERGELDEDDEAEQALEDEDEDEDDEDDDDQPKRRRR